MRSVNEDEAGEFARLTLARPVTVRFIEYMPLGDAQVMHMGSTMGQGLAGPSAGCGGQDRGPDVLVPESETRDAIERELGPLVPVNREMEAGGPGHSVSAGAWPAAWAHRVYLGDVGAVLRDV